jgi:peptide/nickel transport system substrate-binding protein
VKSPDYWGNGGPAEKATFRVLPDGSSRYAALQTGAIDLMQSIPLPLLKDLEGNKNLKLALTTRVIAPYFKITHEAPPAALKAGANLTIPPALRDKRVRQAMNMAVDRKGIAKTLFAGTAQESLWALPSDEWADAKWFTQYPYDVNKAKALLKEAGFESGFELNMYTIIGERLPQIKETTEAVAAYLRAVNIRPNLKPMEYAQWLELVFNSRPPWSDGLMFHWNNPAGQVNPIAGFQTNYWSGGATAMLNNATHDDFYTKMVSAPTRPDVMKLFREWGNFESDFVTNIYGWAFVTPWALRSDRISATALGDTDYFRIHDLTAV